MIHPEHSHLTGEIDEVVSHLSKRWVKASKGESDLVSPVATTRGPVSRQMYETEYTDNIQDLLTILPPAIADGVRALQ